MRFLTTLLVDASRKPDPHERRHHFAWEEAPVWNVRVSAARSERLNPVHRAREWQAAMDTHGESRADLARRLGVSRARVTQVLQVLELDPEVVHLLDHASANPLITERAVRRLGKLPPQEQWRVARELINPDDELSCCCVALE